MVKPAPTASVGASLLLATDCDKKTTTRDIILAATRPDKNGQEMDI
ncbi:MAG: hypothetical protein KME07_06350 [Pegethrix bostrychoides GSE-TBD4-15B]|uniref:Uncharacterized protein n=1 Tax=Pegethrix bostrychoides GSE-TBD4-15B TaxID=2839662 RepID=A0A951U3X6_9CYAN|nr:hypothetical protein [Pegethrix bostrychoides GSE-TBD4-15B]